MQKDVSLPDRRLFVILPSAFLTAVGVGLISLDMLFILKEVYGATPVTVAWFAALSLLGYFVGCVGFRPLAQRIRASDSMTFMNAASAAALTAQLIIPSLVSAFIAYTLIGLFTALYWPRLEGWLTYGIEGAALGRASGAFSVSWSAGSALAPYLAGLMAERGLFIPVYVAIAIFAVNAVFIAFGRGISPAPEPERRASPPGENHLRQQQDGALKTDHSTPLRYPAWIGVFIIYAFVAVFFNIFPLFARGVLGFSEATIGFILLVRAIAMSLGFLILSRLTLWQFRPTLLPLAILAALALDLAFIAIRSPLGFCVGLAAAGIVQAGLYGASIFYGTSGALDRDNRVTIHESLLTAGQILGTLIAGVLYQLLSWPFVFMGIGLVMALGLVGQIAVLRRGR